MNRETKIGLLVGLAFIIVIGVLLSDHIQTSTQPRTAALAQSGESLRSGVAAPGGQNPGAVAVAPPSAIELTGPVPTNDLLVNEHQTQPRIDIGPADDGAGSNGAVSPNLRNSVAEVGENRLAVGPGVEPYIKLPSVIAVNNTNGLGSPGSSSGGNVVTPYPDGAKSPPLTASGPQSGGQAGTSKSIQQTSVASSNQHTAVSGDSVYKLAVRYYGGYSKFRENLITNANPTLAKGGKIVIGSTYTIPALPAAAAPTMTADAVLSNPPKTGSLTNVPSNTPTNPPANPPVSNRPSVVAAKGDAKSDAPKSDAPKAPLKSPTYTVKNGDSLWKIASTTGASIREIKSLNKDLLKGGETVQPGMTLKLPQKQVASVN